MTNKQKNKKKKGEKKTSSGFVGCLFPLFFFHSIFMELPSIFSPFFFAPIVVYGVHADICVHVGAHLHVYAFMYVCVWKSADGVACFS